METGVTMDPPSFDWVGAGIGYRAQHRHALLEGSGPAVLEVVPDHFFAHPEALLPLAERYPFVLHDVGQSVGTVFAGRDLTATRLERIKAVCDVAKPLLFSDHLALTRGPDGTDLGHLAPLWYTHDAAERVIDRVHRLQEALGVPVALENITAPFVVPGADYSEADFFHRVVEATGCGVLLDLTNLLINGRNFGFDPLTRMGDYPLHAVVQVHLAGGFDDHGWWVDTHSHAVEDQSYALLAALRGRAPLGCVVVERDDHLPSLDVLVAEADRAGTVWERGIWG